MTTELPTDAIKQLFVIEECDCEEECYCYSNRPVVELANKQLQALIDALKEKDARIAKLEEGTIDLLRYFERNEREKGNKQ